MVIAEAIKFDTGEVVLILLAALAWLGVLSAILGAIGLAVGFTVGRRGLDEDAVGRLRRGSLFWLWAVACVLPVPSWVVFWWIAGGVYTGPGWQAVLPASGIVAPAIWGFWNGRERRYSDSRTTRLPPPPADLPPPPDPVP